MSNEILHKKIEEQFNSLFNTPPGVPEYIKDNLSHLLREYQEQALRQLIFTQEADNADLSFNHLLFHMATGSGKTLVLASTILYLFKEHNQQNFIFFVNSDAIIKKTYDNLTNESSSKYLFRKEGIMIDGQRISIQVVDVFPAFPDANTIYLKLTTIQKLHMDLTEPRENALTYESLENNRLVLLADEAHHINAWTRRDKRKLNTKEYEERTWENTVNTLLQLNPANRLLEYTATINLNQDVLFEKYKDKIVYQYDLRRFMNDGYSKNVVLLRADEADENKMLNAILLSQYRKYIAQENDITLKPIILFKSNKIATSVSANERLLNTVQGLNVESLSHIINLGHATYKHENSIWSKMFEYYKDQSLPEVIRDLQWDFTEETILNANDKAFLSEDNALLLNTLEEDNNPIRAIFAVAKLNEGWDVLNLFDIVRISEGATSTKTTTDSEAQLIGRGARYYPFEYQEERSYTRRFDLVRTDLKVIESLHYHTINENAYIKNLEKSLESASIQLKEDEYDRLEAKLKPAFKKSPVFKNGKIYINKLEKTTADDYRTLSHYNVTTTYEIPFEITVEQHYGKRTKQPGVGQTHEVTWYVEHVYIRKALQRKPFFHFNNFKTYIPALSSMKDFIENPDFLGELNFYITMPLGLELHHLSPLSKLKMVEKYFDYVEKKMKANYMKERGTPVFEGVSMPELINDYYIELNKVNTKVSNMNEAIQRRNMRDNDWYVYDQAIVNGLESSFINFINDYVEELKEKYQEVYLIRNERKVKIVEINGTRGFMPDFLLYLQGEDYTYQVFLEPKGSHLQLEDRWKEEFLLSLNQDERIEVLSENDEVKLLGIKFYSNESEQKQDFRQDFKNKLL
ncbi:MULTISPECIES: DEAD/DEAH box helicase family protein [Staphylococcaceae]|uniref:Putative type III restriction endonuclease n=1 Tax=Staphylococcus aureus TaxID=1280 RepID=A0A499S0V3_STAAU|nr:MULTISPECIES: DEAD/DEAH box helicase family protein [Staphylococcaceae]AYK27876.1 putative type III restriction endonuclease [Staphylococcus aureus]RCV80579.1 restriction endonuclease subunit R [Staphylococcus aureus]RIO03365.1 DEAD/DEAH box helicase [Mammaliicoccus sciuri]